MSQVIYSLNQKKKKKNGWNSVYFQKHRICASEMFQCDTK